LLTVAHGLPLLAVNGAPKGVVQLVQSLDELSRGFNIPYNIALLPEQLVVVLLKLQYLHHLVIRTVYQVGEVFLDGQQFTEET
jgi:hypothetical protein